MSQNFNVGLYIWKLITNTMTASNRGTSDSQLKKIPTTKDNFGLTKSEFEVYIVKLSQGDESLFTKVFKAHFHESVAYLKLRFRIEKEVAYDTCMNTLLEFRKKLLEGKIKYGNLRYLFTKMAINNHINDLRRNQKTKTAIDVFMDGNDLGSVDKQYFFNALDKALEGQDADTIKIIDELFYVGKHVNKLAEESGVSNATMRKRKQRIIDKLKLTFFDIIKSERSL